MRTWCTTHATCTQALPGSYHNAPHAGILVGDNSRNNMYKHRRPGQEVCRENTLFPKRISQSGLQWCCKRVPLQCFRKEC